MRFLGGPLTTEFYHRAHKLITFSHPPQTTTMVEGMEGGRGGVG